MLPFFEKNVVSEEVLAPFSNRGPSENSLPTLMTTQCLVAFKLLPFSKGGLSSYDAIDIKKVGMSCYGTKSTCLLYYKDGLKRGMTSVMTIQYLLADRARDSF